jgi:hypothetical protein
MYAYTQISNQVKLAIEFSAEKVREGREQYYKC